MMGQGFADRIGRLEIALIIIVLIVAFAAGVIASWFFAYVWLFIKPFIHVVTA